LAIQTLKTPISLKDKFKKQEMSGVKNN